MKDGIGITGIGLVLTVIIANGPASYSQTWVQATRFVFPGRINPSRRKWSFLRESCDFDSKSGKRQGDY